MSSHEASTDPSRGNIVLLNVVFGLVMFANAYLLFQVQPLISKAILPWFGGTPAVWNTCLLFFQITLFGGYLYAHLLSTKLLLKTQLVGHGLLLLLACIVLPIRPNPEWKPDGTAGPTRILGDMQRLSSLRLGLSFVRSRLSALRSMTDYGEPVHAGSDTRRCRFHPGVF